MRVERIQPDLRQAEGTAQGNRQEQQKVNELANPQSQDPSEEEKVGLEKEKLLDEKFMKALGEKVEQLNKTVEAFDKRLHFKMHEETDRVLVQVVDAETKEVIKEIPPERVLDMMARIEEAIGILVDEKF